MLNSKFKSENICFMQYTGLKDCVGVEIYEGDILNGEYDFNDEALIIRWCSIKCAYELTNIFGQLMDSVWDWNSFTSLVGEQIIIGNIYENPELLENDND